MNRVDDVFADALDLPPSERAAFLSRVCVGDDALRARVETLLDLHDEARGFLDEPLTTRGVFVPEEKPDEQIGRYTLRQKIGEGGCGVVYLAEQEEPVHRRVAIKVIKLGMDTKAVIARFGAEQQALAMMDHPNIAKVFDGGVTHAGRPFFVMELVHGVPVTQYCDEQMLGTSARLELFTQVCRAFGHAHRHGIVHRDIKPSNILVSLHDGIPVPKVIDFGIAKATQGRLTDATLFTASEQIIGTPAYMSPEQAESGGLDVDPRSDIYSLGVLLYQLLTGRTPFETTKLMHAGLDEMRRQIREVDPPRPSTRLRTLEKEAQKTIAERRHTVAPKLIDLVHGDLDWIVMRCLEKDRARRYATADALAADIVRHLKNEPVSACPPSVVYRFNKALRRRQPVVAAAVAGGILIAGFAWLLEHRSVRVGATTARAAGDSSSTPFAADQKSIVVLPFANLSEDRDASAFFSDGMHDDITTNLAHIRELRVTSRTTAMQYRDTKKTLRQIAEELRVAYILEGTVWRAGNRVRVTGRLINARTDQHVWANTYHRGLSDMFVIQAALAQEIAAALRAVISPQEKFLIERPPTNNLAAYDLLLKAREFRRALTHRDEGAEAIGWLEDALRLDPNLVPAWVELAYLESLNYQVRYAFKPAEQVGSLARARRALETAAALAPNSPEVIRGFAEYFYRCHLDYSLALQQLDKLFQLQPRDVAGLALVAAIRRRQGQWTAALDTFRTVVQLDPGNFTNGRDLISVLVEVRRFDEARQEQQRLVDRQPPEDLQARFDLAYLSFLAGGATEVVDAFFRGLSAQQASSVLGINLRKFWALRRGDFAVAAHLDRIQPGLHNDEALAMAVISAAQGDAEGVRARLEDLPGRLRAMIERYPNQHRLWEILAEIEAVLGHKEEAFKCANRAVDLVPVSRDAVEGARARAHRAFVKAWTGDKDGAIADYAELLRTPYGNRGASNEWFRTATVHVMRHDPHYFPLRGDPRFEALLNDPKSNEPLL